MGTPADITVIAASDNTWDNVKSVKMSYIGMQSDDTSTSSTKGTLFVNCELDADENYSAHSIPVFVGITFDLYSTDAGWSTDDFPGPTNDDVNTALTLTGLASDGETLIDISGDFAVTGNTDYRNSYYKATASAP